MSKKPRRPLTQRELRQQKQRRKDVNYVTIINRSKKQTVPIQLKAPVGVDFFVGEQTIPLYPLRMAKFPENRLYSEQIRNFQKQGRIQVLNAS
jgi:hypothetical protein